MPTHSVIDPVVRFTPLDVPSSVFFALAFAAIAYASARRPSLGIALLALAIPFSFTHDVAHTTVTLGKVALLANVLGLALRREGLATLRAPSQRIFVLCALAVLVTTALSITQAADRAAALRETLKAVEYLVLFCSVAVSFAADPDERPIRFALLASTALVSVLALADLFLGAHSGLWFHGVAIPRIAGPLEGPNQLAAYLGLVLAALAALGARRTDARLEIAAVSLGSVALVLTISRSGVLASFAALGIALALRRGAQSRPLLLSAVAGGTFGLAVIAFLGYAATHTFGGVDLIGRFSTLAEADAPGAVGTRSQLWHAAFVLWRAHPVLGIGAGNFENELGLAGYPWLHTHANSYFLQALAEGGIPSFGAALALVYASIARFARGPFDEPFVAGALAASIGLGCHQLFDLLVFFPKVGDQWWLLLALAAVRSDRLRRAT